MKLRKQMPKRPTRPKLVFLKFTVNKLQKSNPYPNIENKNKR